MLQVPHGTAATAVTMVHMNNLLSKAGLDPCVKAPKNTFYVRLCFLSKVHA